MSSEKQLLSIVELGGYPDFSSLYKQFGYTPEVVYSMRKALGLLKKSKPTVIVAEFNYQSDFRDRTSSLESLIAVVQQNPKIKLIVFYEKEYEHQFEKLRARHKFYATVAFPIKEKMLVEIFNNIDKENIS